MLASRVPAPERAPMADHGALSPPPLPGPPLPPEPRPLNPSQPSPAVGKGGSARWGGVGGLSWLRGWGWGVGGGAHLLPQQGSGGSGGHPQLL